MRTITNGEDVETLEPYITDRNVKYYSCYGNKCIKLHQKIENRINI